MNVIQIADVYYLQRCQVVFFWSAHSW